MKHMKKNDGYVVVYVLIVFTILSLVAVSICSVALKNLKAQRASVDRMEIRYEAEGYLQEFVAKIGQLKSDVEVESTAAAEAQFWGAMVPLENSNFTVDEDADNNSFDAEANKTKIAELTVHATYTENSNTAQIDAVLKVPVTVTEHPIPDDPATPEDETDSQYTYQVSGPIQYKDYTISYEGGGAG